jgi:uncharacterized protein
MYVIPPGVDFEPEQYRVLDFAAYHRLVKARLERAIEQNRNGITTFAEPTASARLCSDGLAAVRCGTVTTGCGAGVGVGND